MEVHRTSFRANEDNHQYNDLRSLGKVEGSDRINEAFPDRWGYLAQAVFVQGKLLE